MKFFKQAGLPRYLANLERVGRNPSSSAFSNRMTVHTLGKDVARETAAAGKNPSAYDVHEIEWLKSIARGLKENYKHRLKRMEWHGNEVL